MEALADFIYEHYQVEFSSRQSYSALLHEAGITWKKAQGVNPT
ncbi:winged helix-turn-helix domain-containing protein [Anthocerotibacter panamensis]